ncbi:hypothetical protein JGH11_16565 [Dysgonomonas sp. Marseille-P4677]|uniref:hypothetical protein n=1 Tax=Dysgonomonas sp. Marseille-P4677 TaxID=2364790 RepID=UPI00191218FE|nr:hypothetical protein [Dysgonomonas sp. Marseille-P4677]MBK5722488.1 hypothetical protein [Dysgonomonas sp. Marseille-P4677]
MKQLIFAFAACVLIFSSCQSKEDKAKELVKDDLYKTLHDFGSYEPIEWTELKPTYDVSKEPKERRDTLLYYGMKRMMLESFSGGDGMLKEESYVGEYEQKRKRYKTIEDSIQALMPIKGYTINHTYRANTLGGNKRISTVRYDFDAELTKAVKKEEEKSN